MSDLTTLWRFNRPKLARALAKRLAAHERVAMFGPRQTGKTTLLRQEVIPALQGMGLVAVYIDCWADRRDPLGSINYALTKALESIEIEPRGLKRAALTPVKRFGIAGASMELGDPARRQLPESPFLRFDSLLTQLL